MKRSVFGLILVFAALSYSAVAQQPTPEAAPISKTEVATLLRHASTPADHLRIAAYYRQESARLNAQAQEHARLAEIYTKQPPFPGMEMKHGKSFGAGASHCRHWADLDQAAAAHADALATLHDEMAKTPGKQ